MDGYRLAQLLRVEHPALRLVAVSGYGQESDHQRSLDAGFTAHLVKPVAFETIVALLQTLPLDGVSS